MLIIKGSHKNKISSAVSGRKRFKIVSETLENELNYIKMIYLHEKKYFMVLC